MPSFLDDIDWEQLRAVAGRVARITGIGFGVAAALSLAALIVLFLALQITPVRTVIVDRALDFLGEGDGLTVELEGYGGIWPVRLEAERLTVRDGGEVLADASDLVVVWSPLALLGGTVHVDVLQATRVSVGSVPQGTDAGPRSAPGPLIPSLPVDLQVDALRLPDIHLAPGVAGPDAAALSAEGSIALVEGVLTSDFSAQRTDGGRFDLTLNANIHPEADQFDLDLVFEDGGPGAPGLVAGLTGNDDLSVLTVRARAHGPAENWTASADASLGTLGRLTLRLDGDRRPGGSVDLAAQFDPGPAIPELPADVQIVADVKYDGLALTARDMRLASDALLFDGTAVLNEPRLAPKLSLNGSLDGLAAQYGNRLPEKAALALEVEADSRLSIIRVTSLGVEADGFTLGVEGALDLVDGTGRGTIDLAAADIEPLAALARVDAAGPLTARAELPAFTLAGGVEGSLEAVFTPVRLPVEGLAEAIGNRLAIDGRFSTADSGRTTRIDRLTLVPASGHFEASGSGDFSMERVAVDVAILAEDLAPFSRMATVRLSGSGQLDGQVRGPREGPDLDATVTVRQAQVAGIAVDGALSAEVTTATGLSGPVAFNGTIAGSDAAVSAQFSSQAGVTAIEDISAQLLDLAVTGSASFAPGGAVTANLDGDIASLAGIGRLAGMPLAGSGRFSLASDARDTGNRITADATLRGVQAADAGVQRVALAAVVTPDGDVQADLTLQRLAVGGFSASSGTVRVSGVPETASLAAALNGISTFDDQTGTGTLALDARLDAARSSLSVTRLGGRVAATDLSLAQPVRIDFGDGVRVEDLTLAAGAGRLVLSVAQRTGALSVQADVLDLPLGLVTALAGQTTAARGTVSGELSLQGTGRSGTGDLSLTIEPVTLTPQPGVGGSRLASFSLGGTWNGRALDARLTADMPGTEDLTATATLPLVARSGVPALPSRPTLDARVVGTLDLGAVWPLLPIDAHLMTGLVAVDLSASGLLADMEIAGSARLSGGTYESFETGLVMTPLDVVADTRAGLASITVSARDGATGRLDGQGRFGLKDDAVERLRVDLDMTSFRVLGRDDLTALATGTMGVVWPRGTTGEARPLTVNGDLTVDRLDARIPDRLAADIKTIDVTRVAANGEPIDPDAENDSSTEPEASSIVLALDVRVPRAAFVRGRGLESEWAGALNLKGDISAPQLNGAFEVERGTFDFLGKIFNITGGRIEFTGAEEIDPYLDIKAVYERAEFQAIVTLTGLSSDPSLEVSSVPLLPQEEILARVLFGRGTGQLTAFQAVQLANAAATLAGASSGTGVLDTLRRTLGVDVLSVGEDGVEVGSYVGDGVYVGVSQGLEAGSGEVNVEVELTDEFSLESDVGSTGDTSVGVTWERDY